MATVDAGVRVPCSACGETVLQKAMIPMAGQEESGGVRYVCNDCARKDVVIGVEAAASGAGEPPAPPPEAAPVR